MEQEGGRAFCPGKKEGDDDSKKGGTGLLAVWTEVNLEVEGELNERYNTEHIPQLLGVPGFLSGRRYRFGGGRTQVFYELADEAYGRAGLCFGSGRFQPTGRRKCGSTFGVHL